MIDEIISTLQEWLWTASREMYWPHDLYVARNVPIMIYLSAALAALFILIGVIRAMRVWFIGKYHQEDQKFIPFFFELVLKSIKNLFSKSFFKRISYSLASKATNRTKQGKGAFLIHSCILLGVLGSAIATSILSIHEWVFHEELLVGLRYYIFAAFADLAAILLVIGTSLALVRRYVFSRNYYPQANWEDLILLLVLFGLGVTGIFVEASRIFGSLFLVGEIPPFEIVSFSGYALAMVFQSLGLPSELFFNLHFPVYLFHLALAFTLAAMLPYTKIFHVGVGVANIMLDDFDKNPKGRLQFNSEGIQYIENFTFKELLECSACMKCHFCHNYCPAQTSGEVLSPLKVVQDIKKFGRKQYGLFHSNKAISVHGEDSGITQEVLWGCVTCNACVEACPVLIGHVKMIVGLRAYLIEEGEIPGTLTDVMESVYNNGNIWGQHKRTRTDWAKKLDFAVPEVKNTETKLLWLPGDTLAFDPRNHKVARAMAIVLQKCGVEYGILGQAERNDGNDIRRLGEEALFQMLAEENITIFKKNKVSKIITSSPHAFNTIKNEYPELENGVFEVVHYTEFIWDLIQQRKIKFTRDLNYTVTYHDPCYLGRYNNVFEAPRNILQAIPGIKFVEMSNNRKRSFCCGGGGGGMFRETPENVKMRISEIRIREAYKTQASIVITACPFCTSMLVDATKTQEIDEELEVKDLIELVLEAMS
ncbi:MAG: (Fe-S)-binding protein [Promethearchaeota archaeon]